MRISVDLSKCRGCKSCELICSSRFEKAFNPKKARLRILSEGLPEKFTINICQQCMDLPCAQQCPVKAISMGISLSIVEVNEDLCTGCGVCVNVCPYGAIFIHPVTNKAIKCDVCKGNPLCVEICPFAALSLIK